MKPGAHQCPENRVTLHLIRLTDTLDLPTNLVTGLRTPDLPPAAQLLHTVDLW